MAHQESFLPRSPIGLLSVSGLLQPGNESTSFSQLAPCFYHEWIYLRFLARVDEDAVLSDSAHSGGMAADAVVPVALHRPWVCLDSEALVRWSSEIRQDLFWWWAHRRLELVNSLSRVSSLVRLVVRLFRCRLGSRLNPFRGSEWTLNLSVFQQLQ